MPSASRVLGNLVCPGSFVTISVVFGDSQSGSPPRPISWVQSLSSALDDSSTLLHRTTTPQASKGVIMFPEPLPFLCFYLREPL